MTHSDFLRKVDVFFAEFDGKAADFDHNYGNQCKDVFSYFNHDVVGNDTYIFGNGVDLWTTCMPSGLYEQIPNTPAGIPQKGDIVIWGKPIGKYTENGVTKYAGHVAIASGDGDVNRFRSFDENWPVGSLCHFQEHNYSSVIGWLRPKNINDPETPPPPQPDPKDATIVALQNKCNELQEQLTVCQNKPPVEKIVEVTKEVPVEKIVEKEVIKEVPVDRIVETKVTYVWESLIINAIKKWWNRRKK